MNLINLYNIYIFEAYLNLKNNNKEINNNNLWKIFEWYSCIKLFEKYNQHFYLNEDIYPEFKEINKMSQSDTGIDACNLIDTIVQCKLRNNTLNWNECSTFFGSQNIFSNELNKTIIRWDKLVICRNSNSKLSNNLIERKNLFIDYNFEINNIIDYCNNLILNPPEYPLVLNNNIELRDYQIECISFIKNSNKNIIISLPTGCGKNIIMINSIEINKKYLILVPRIILMDQFKDELIKNRPELKNNIQTIGNKKHTFNKNKNITICVYNSVYLLKEYSSKFYKIFVDEAHHIHDPKLYDIIIDDNDDDNNNTTNDNDIDNNIDNDNDIDIDIDIDNDNNNDNDNDNDNDDIEDEIKKSSKYISIINSFKEYNNNVYLSATINKIENFGYYKKDIRDMIEQKYLCDYTINVPIFSDDPSNKNICEYLTKYYTNTIIYCNTQKEGKIINNIMNSINNNCCEYLDCKTSTKTRNEILNKYKQGKIPFLVNVRLLVEGFDAPITKGICFMHLPSNDISLIQIIGRALRLHPLKTYSKIILPYSTNDDDKHIKNFIKIISNNDSRIKKSFINKTFGGYINIINQSINNNDLLVEFRYDSIYNSIGKIINYEEKWIINLNKVIDYIEIHKKRPSKISKDKYIKFLGNWLTNMLIKFNSINFYSNKIKLLGNDFINKYKIYIDNKLLWKNNLDNLKNYIDLNNKRPIKCDDTNISFLAEWINTQNDNYKNNKQIMKDNEIKSLWENFINNDNYKNYFVDNKTEWKINLDKLKKYLDNYNKKPSLKDEDNNLSFLCRWVNHQNSNYRNDNALMKDNEIKSLWQNFINDNKYKKYFSNNLEKWHTNLEKLKNYIIINKKYPSIYSKDTNIKSLSKWLQHQRTNYTYKLHIMSDINIRTIWENFINNNSNIIT